MKCIAPLAVAKGAFNSKRRDPGLSSDFLRHLHQTVRKLQSSGTTNSVDVAYLGNALLKDQYSWKDHGFGRLSEALEQLQRDGLAELFRDPKGSLHVRTAGEPVDPGAVQQPLSLPQHQARFRPLRSQVWFAFTTPLPSGQQRLINRRTGAILGGAGSPTDSRDDWAPVVPVDEDEQRRWAKEFLDAEPAEGDDKEVLDTALQVVDWYRQFPARLDERRRRNWNRRRSERVIDYAKSWAREHRVADAALFVAAPTSGELQRPPVGPTDLRRALLDVVAKLPTDDLLALPIQARLVIEVVRPDLLK